MKKNWLYLLLTAFPLMAGMTACDNNDDPNPDPDPEPTTTLGAYIVNTGNWGANDGSLQWYDLTNQSVSGDLYAAQNGKGIGDLQDLCLYGTKLYAICATSSKVEILERNGKLVKSLAMNTSSGQPMEPRYATAGEGCIFFTAYDGTVSKLDTLTQTVTASVAVGDHPEALTYAEGKLFVNISGYGSGDKVAVVDAKTMTKLQDITVKLNPYTQCITGSDGYVYVVSNGNYAGSESIPENQWIRQTLQRIDPKTYAVEELCNATYIANKGDKMYVIYAEYYLPDTHKCFVYDLKNQKETALPISLEDFSSPGFIQIDPVTEDIYIGDQIYGALNSIRIYSKDGQYKKSIETGMSTSKVVFVSE